TVCKDNTSIFISFCVGGSDSDPKGSICSPNAAETKSEGATQLSRKTTEHIQTIPTFVQFQ
ncbi:MAG: hypothetical protein WB706_09335, partial [Nitrososphaeraceae archaeon]